MAILGRKWPKTGGGNGLEISKIEIKVTHDRVKLKFLCFFDDFFTKKFKFVVKILQ